MHPSMTWQLARQQGQERRHRASEMARHRAAGGGRTGAGTLLPRPDRPTLLARRQADPSRRLSVWFGYRMIGLGCRLARPDLVPVTGAGA